MKLNGNLQALLPDNSSQSSVDVHVDTSMDIGRLAMLYQLDISLSPNEKIRLFWKRNFEFGRMFCDFLS